jgi:hypothetical protein
MIIRIFSEGQYEIPDGAVAGLEQLDDDTQAAIDAGDEQRFHDLYQRLLDQIRQAGTPLASDDLRPSDLIALPADTSLAEAAREFHGHGLIPD